MTPKQRELAKALDAEHEKRLERIRRAQKDIVDLLADNCPDLFITADDVKLTLDGEYEQSAAWYMDQAGASGEELATAFSRAMKRMQPDKDSR